jgi:MarR family transcriptional regulator for hemolysin
MTQLQDIHVAFTSSLQPTRQAWYQAAVAALVGTGVSATVGMPLVLIGRLGDGISQQTLSRRLGVAPAALVRTLDQAEAAELLERRVVPGNRRKWGIYLLPEGKRLAKRIEGVQSKLRAEFLRDITTADMEVVIRVLQTFEERARKYVEEEQ